MTSRTRRRRGAIVAVLLVLATVAGCGDDSPGADRVLLVGDSVMNQVAPALEQQFGPRVDVRNEAVYGSGLLTPWLFDWREHLARVMDDNEPDVVVFLFVGNYRFDDGRRFRTQGGDVVEDRTDPDFFDAWAEQSDALMQIIDGRAEVIWVLPPPRRSAVDQRVVEGLRAVELQLSERWPGIRYVDAYEFLAGPGGRYLATGPGPDGEEVQLRADDGVHLTPAGGRLLAEPIAAEIRAALDG